jgi:hypothetical protein
MIKNSLTACVLLMATAASAQVPQEVQKKAGDVVKKYAIDMTAVVPCFYMQAPESIWDTGFGEPDLNRVLDRYAKDGASSAQISALRLAYSENFRPQWVQDIRDAARTCHRDHIFEYIAIFDGPAKLLMLRFPFSQR